MFSAMLLTTNIQAQDAEKADEPKAPVLETVKDKASYAIGFNIGTDIKNKGLELEPEMIAAGIAAALAGKESALTEEQIRAAFAALEKEMKAQSASKATKNLDVGKQFLEENKSKEGVKVTKSGLQYLVIKEGTGATPTTDSTVTAHYRGTFINGKKFDGTYEGKEPAATDEPIPFPVTGVIAGWTEALQLMKVGAHYRLFIPGDLAYGEEGRPGIEPNSVLIFDIHLVGSEG
jgi:FKBP-type peptidyl-prolyl cis-trans isomerase